MRKIESIDFGWKFSLGNGSDPTKDYNFGLEGIPFAKVGLNDYKGIAHKFPLSINFSDDLWESVNLPHDWALSLDPLENGPAGNNYITEDVKHGFKPVLRQHASTCIGWYRRKFKVSKDEKGLRFYLRFDGIFRDSQVWINGIYCGRHESGYTSFGYDITEMLYYDKDNVITVRVDTSHPAGWWYEGAGIYRHVWLEKTNPLFISHNGGVFVHHEIVNNITKTYVDLEIENNQDEACEYEIKVTLFDGEDVFFTKPIKNSNDAWETTKRTVEFSLENYKLWSPENPFLYNCTVEIIKNNKVMDIVSLKTGIRSIRMDADKGLYINDKPYKIKGVCCHQDHAGVGVALPDALQEYRIMLLKQMGVNAYRCAHNPPTPELLDMCDKYGMIVMDENRLMSSGYSCTQELVELVKRDRNHPSVVFWSIGNEEGGIQDNDIGYYTSLKLNRIVKSLDSTRILTYGGNNGDMYYGSNAVAEVRGWNYMQIGGIDAMIKYHKDHPHQPIIASEECSTLTTRGIYQKDDVKCYVDSYGDTFPEWGCAPEYCWPFYEKYDYLAGAFMWTGFDYRGEPTPYNWPNVNSHFGIMDMCGFPKDIYYYYLSWWTNNDVLHIFPHWNLDKSEGEIVKLKCYSNCDNVEIIVNGKSYGKKDMPKHGCLYWEVPYEKGTVTAIGYRNFKKIVQEIKTTGDVTNLKIETIQLKDKYHGNISLVNVCGMDRNGDFVPVANNLVKLSIKNGKILGVGNGDPSCHEKEICEDGKWQRSLFNGRCFVIVSHYDEYELSAIL